jgi:hypothetical protein
MNRNRAAVSRLFAAFAIAVSIFSAGCASASRSDGGDGPESDFARPGVYAGLYGIKAFENFHTGGNSVHAGHSDLGAGVKIGYRVASNVAVEFVAENVRGFDIDDGNVDSNLDLLNFGLMGKYYFATERFQPYVIGGFGVARSDVSNFNYDHDGGFLRGGMGADFYLTRNFALFGEANYNRMVGGTSDLHHIDLQLGLIFRF